MFSRPILAAAHLSLLGPTLLLLNLAGCVTAGSDPVPVTAPLRTPATATAASAESDLCQKISKLEIHSHRGAWDRPENMLTAFHRAIDQGADFVEMDLHTSGDEQLIVAHDRWMKRQCNDPSGQPIQKRIYFSDLTVEQIKQYDCGTRVYRGSPVKGEKISTLVEILTALKDRKTLKNRKIRFNIEIKYDPKLPKHYPERDLYVTRLLKDLERAGVPEDQVLVQSFDAEVLKLLRERRPQIRLAILLSDLAKGLAVADSLKADLVTPHFAKVTPELLKELHSRGIRVIPWTVNRPEDARRLIEWGVDGVITDYPEWFNFTQGFCSPVS